MPQRIGRGILDWWRAGGDGPDSYNLYWGRDAAAAFLRTPEGDPAIRRAVHDELLKCGSAEPLRARRLDAQIALYRRHAVTGPFTCHMRTLAKAVARGYGRGKDQITQLQWDGPLSMTALDHYRSALRSSGQS